MKVLICAPRGFCAGVVRAIEVVESALKRYGAPVYVRHEIVHNKYVVQKLKDKGAVFVQRLGDVPDSSAPVIFSAHGVSKEVVAKAEARHLHTIDATCPLVTKVHREAQIHHKKGRAIILIGHAGHPEVEGTLGQLPQGEITLIETEQDAMAYQKPNGRELALVTQTTLSVQDTARIIDVLKSRFADIHMPHTQDICYATTNRQHAVQQVAVKSDAMIILGAANSSNSRRLQEVARDSGCPLTFLIDNVDCLNLDDLKGCEVVGVSAGASAPEELVLQVVQTLKDKYNATVEEVELTVENTVFPLPRQLRKA